MLSPLRNRFGIPGAISVVALVFALVAGAYAAEGGSGDNATASAKKNNRAKKNRKAGGLNGKQKRQVRNIAANIAKRFQGTGPAGPQGVPGIPGPKGPKGDDGDDGSDGQNGQNGENGKDGKDGDDGESVDITSLPSGDANCPDGGAAFSNSTGFAFACNGEGGEGGGYPETLPSGRTLAGNWEVLGEAAVQLAGSAITTISFPLPLEAPPSEIVFIDAGATEEEEDKCPGDASNPETATPGVLCVYPALAVTFNAGFSSATVFGAGLAFGETDKGFGAWALTAP